MASNRSQVRVRPNEAMHLTVVFTGKSPGREERKT